MYCVVGGDIMGGRENSLLVVYKFTALSFFVNFLLIYYEICLLIDSYDANRSNQRATPQT